MRISNELQGPLPASWIGHTRWKISVKLNLIRQVVTLVQSHMQTDGQMDGHVPYLYNMTDFRQAYKKVWQTDGQTTDTQTEPFIELHGRS